MGADNHVVEIRPLEDGIEERSGVSHARVLGKDDRVCDEAIAPAHLDGALLHALNEEKSRGAELHQSKPVSLDSWVDE